MSASQHMVRVVRNAGQPPSKRSPALSPQIRTVLLICLLGGAIYLTAVYLGPELPGFVAGLQSRLALSQYVGS